MTNNLANFWMAAILRLEDWRSELFCTVPYLKGGKVTSTMVNCWMAAILRVEEGRTQLVCTVHNL